VGFLDPSLKDPNFCTILLPSPNSNGCPFANLSLLVGTYISGGLNTTKGSSIPILSFCNSLTCGPPCVYCCCFCYCKFYGLPLLSIYSSYMSPSICGCSSTFGNLVSCSLLIFCLYFFIYISYGDEIYGASTFYFLAYINVGIVDGDTFPFIIF